LPTLNLGIVAHVDAGKTSLTERLLFATGVIDELGSVDDGSTRTDTSDLERRRGITINSAVVSFVVDGVTVNLVDTPGHPDFIAEVERVLGVLDGAVLVVSAVEGVQSQTRVLMRALQRLRVPTLIVVNKIDRRGARDTALLRELADRLSPDVVDLGSVRHLGTRHATFVPHDGASLVEFLADRDDAVLADLVDGRAVDSDRARDVLADLTRRCRAHPVLFGSAITGAGTDALLGVLTAVLPRAADAGGPASGAVFKIGRGPAGEKLTFVRMFTGRIQVRDRLRIGGAENRVTGLEVFDGGPPIRADVLTAGGIGIVRGLDAARIGDPVGRPRTDVPRQFAPPILETVVVPRHPAQRGAVHTALARLVEQDPLLDLRLDGDEIAVSLYGEVQKEVVAATLAEEYGVDVTFRATTTICVERPVGTGAAAEFIGVAPNPLLATVGLRIEPVAPGSGVAYRAPASTSRCTHSTWRSRRTPSERVLPVLARCRAVPGPPTGRCVLIRTGTGQRAGTCSGPNAVRNRSRNDSIGHTGACGPGFRPASHCQPAILSSTAGSFVTIVIGTSWVAPSPVMIEAGWWSPRKISTRSSSP
jgi:ribosomal protection tetracycline resistance protein